MIKTIIVDYDEVLVRAQHLHLKTLNKALLDLYSDVQISEYENSYLMGTIPSFKKLEILSTLNSKVLQSDYLKILDLKNKYINEIADSLPLEELLPQKVIDALFKLKADGYKLYVASNATMSFILNVLERGNVANLFEKIYGNKDVINNKPHPEVYLKAILDSGCSPDECLIIEDSMNGQEAAIKSGAHLFPVESPTDFIYSDIKDFINNLDNKNIKWHSKKINVLIVMAGNSNRFFAAGHKLPKQLLDVNGIPMIQAVVNSLNIEANFIFVTKQEWCEQYNIDIILKSIVPGCTVIKVNGPQGGSVCSALEAIDLINNDNHLLISYSDQYIKWDSRKFYYQMIRQNLDGAILTFEDNNYNNKWSYAKINDDGFVVETAEKKAISNKATIGIYYFKSGAEFVKYSNQMIDKKLLVNNEYYVSPVFNEMILDNKKIITFDVDKNFMLGTPEDLAIYLENNKKN